MLEHIYLWAIGHSKEKYFLMFGYLDICIITIPNIYSIFKSLRAFWYTLYMR